MSRRDHRRYGRFSQIGTGPTDETVTRFSRLKQGNVCALDMVGRYVVFIVGASAQIVRDQIDNGRRIANRNGISVGFLIPRGDAFVVLAGDRLAVEIPDNVITVDKRQRVRTVLTHSLNPDQLVVKVQRKDRFVRTKNDQFPRFVEEIAGPVGPRDPVNDGLVDVERTAHGLNGKEDFRAETVV